MPEISLITSPLLQSFTHGFLGRQGGVSGGIFEGLNVGLGSSDDPAAVSENRARAVAAVMPGAALVTLHQVHSADIVSVTAPFADGERPRADALVTNRLGLLLGILTADCVPVLFGDAKAGVIGAAHAGWKGAIGGVTDATIAAMESLGADRNRIVAAIGPCIGRASYEVRDEFALNFTAHDPANERFFSGGKPGHQFFDIEGYVTHRLATAGITRIDVVGLDTVSDPARFFSYRRATLAGEADYGRQISLIGIARA